MEHLTLSAESGTQATLKLGHGAAKPLWNGPRLFRYATIEECKSLNYGDKVWCLSNSNRALECKVNGSPKTWKTRGDVRVPIKYGLYSYSEAVITVDKTDTSCTYSGNTILIPVETL